MELFAFWPWYIGGLELIRSGTLKVHRKHHKSTKVHSLRWELEAGSLVVIGDGWMPDFTDDSPPPWEEWRQEIREVNLWNLKNVGARAFRNCPNLTDVYLDNAIERMGSECFAGCTALTRVETERTRLQPLSAGGIAHRMDTLYCGRRAFAQTPWGLERMGEFVIRDGILWDYLGAGGEVAIPEGINEIGKYVFENLEITAATLPQSLHRIRAYGFAGTKIREIVFPAELREVDGFAFANIHNLQRVILENEDIMIRRDAFYGTALRHRHSEKRHAWNSLYTLTPEKEKGIAGAGKLVVRPRKGPCIGVRPYDLGEDLFRRVRRGNLIVRICLDEEEKRVEYVQSFRWHPNWECFETYLMYPCAAEGEEAEPWRDSYTYWDSWDMRHCCTEGLEGGEGRFRWYRCSADRWDMGCGPEIDLLQQWLRKNPQYRVNTIPENLGKDRLRMFVPA